MWPTRWLIPQMLEGAQLIGSRGFARHCLLPEPVGADYDYAIFTDAPRQIEALRRYAEVIVKYESDYKIIERPRGFTLHGPNIDVSVVGTIMRQVTLRTWDLMRTGTPALTAWRYAHHEFNVPCPD